MSVAVADHAWYLCAVLALCPPIAVLGSRRPGTRVWAWFILFPMLLALCWPIIALRLQGSEFRGLLLEIPQLLAFGLVLVMGVGNYCGTKYTMSAMLYGVALLAMVGACSTFAWPALGPRSATRFWATVAMVVSILVASRAERPTGNTRFDHVWFDFFDSFGIVWGRRIQDRINFVAQKEHWPVRLELDGFITTETCRNAERLPESAVDSRNKHFQCGNVPHLDSQVEDRIDHTLRWLLRRFVDPAWIDQRLMSQGGNAPERMSVDS